MLTSCLPFLISHTWALRALALSWKALEGILRDLPALICSLVPENGFPGVVLNNSLNSWKVAFLKLVKD